MAITIEPASLFLLGPLMGLVHDVASDAARIALWLRRQVKMLPRLATLNAPDGHSRYVECCHDLPGLAFVVGDLAHQLGAQNRPAVLLPLDVIAAALSDLVRLIVGIGAQEQMVRVNAMADIAAVADEQTDRNWAACDLPCKAVRGYPSLPESKEAIAWRVSPSDKENAAGRRVWPRPCREALLQSPSDINTLFHGVGVYI